MYPLSNQPRFVTTPTVLEVYENERLEPNLRIEQTDKEELSKEYDRTDGVDGTEGFYKLLFSELPYDIEEVEGTESFSEWVKTGLSKLIETVKAFFKWIGSYFISKDRVTEEKISEAKQRLKQNGVKTGPVEYPGGYRSAFGKTGKIPENIHWVPESAGVLEGQISLAEEGMIALKGLFEKIDDKKIGEFHSHLDRYHKENEDLFNAVIKQRIFVGGNRLIKNTRGEIRVEKNAELNNRLDGAKAGFQTSGHEVETYLNKLDNLLTKKAGYGKKVTSLEGVIVDKLNKLSALKDRELSAQEKKNVEAIEQTVKNAMVMFKSFLGVFNTTYLHLFNVVDRAIKE